MGDKGAAVADARLPPPTDPAWWAVFRDPVLTDLERRVADANLDVRTATIRLAESRFQRGVTAAAEFPSINGDAKYTRELYSQNGIVSLLSGLLPPGSSFNPGAINDYNVGFDASWELDLWGKVRRQVEAADAQVDQAADQLGRDVEDLGFAVHSGCRGGESLCQCGRAGALPGCGRRRGWRPRQRSSLRLAISSPVWRRRPLGYRRDRARDHRGRYRGEVQSANLQVACRSSHPRPSPPCSRRRPPTGPGHRPAR